jgi:hypothetical protein
VVDVVVVEAVAGVQQGSANAVAVPERECRGVWEATSLRLGLNFGPSVAGPVTSAESGRL